MTDPAKAQVREDLLALLGKLSSFGITTSEQLAALLREDGPYPSGAYVRLMLSPRDEPPPSERFVKRVRDLRSYVDEQLATPGADLIVTRDGLYVRDRYHPEAALRFVRSIPDQFVPSEIVLTETQEGTVVGALVYISAERLAHCRECTRMFVKRTTRSLYCGPACRTAARKRRGRGAFAHQRTPNG